jgi:hypothetical protein
MATPKNIIDLQKELLIQVAGKEEENHTISWELLRKIGDNTQKLIDTLVKSSTEEGISTENTKLIFVGFFPGSAVPAWKLDEEPNLLFPVKKAVKTLNNDFNFVLHSIDEGNFQQIADKYNEPSVKNEVINAVYDFSNSVGTKPFTIVKRDSKDITKFKPLAKVRKMTIKQKGLLTVKVDVAKENHSKEAVEAVGKFIISTTAKGGTSKKLSHFYTQKEAVLSLTFDSIETDKRFYQLKGKLSFEITNDDKKSVVVENQLLDIYAQGSTMLEAEQDIFEQFDYTYRRLTEIEDKKLSRHLLDAKKYITLIVDTIKEK